jgi:antitoxin (DNA-binding transcriptional repressor) of toxin-antitoxin stability system
MESTQVGIREFRSGLAKYIAANNPVAVTRHGQTVGIFIPTGAPLQADLHALEQATARFAELMPLSEAEVAVMAADFETERKAARRRARK